MTKKTLYTDINIKRMENFLDKHLENETYLTTGAPTFSSVEISINGACNRRCFFCPRVDEKKYPNILNSLDLDVYQKLVNDLKKINFNGRISFSGFCEPLLTKNLNEYIGLARENLPNIQIEIVSNGDPLVSKNGKIKLKELFEAGLDNCRISLYDGPHQINYFEKIKKELNLSDEKLIIRKRYLGPEESFGLTISNRAGSVKLKNEFFELKPLEKSLNQPCYYPFYKVLIDNNGDVLICSNDWKKEAVVGNISKESLIIIWSSSLFLDIRKNLLKGSRCHKPCAACDVNGLMNGKKSFDRWKKYLSK